MDDAMAAVTVTVLSTCFPVPMQRRIVACIMYHVRRGSANMIAEAPGKCG